MGMSHKRRCNLATKAKQRHKRTLIKIEIKHIALGPINSSFEGIRKSVHYVHPGLLNHNHLVISNKIHEKHVAIPETNGEVTTLFGDDGSRARVCSFPLPSWTYFVANGAQPSSRHMPTSSNVVGREYVGVFRNRLIEVNNTKISMGTLSNNARTGESKKRIK